MTVSITLPIKEDEVTVEFYPSRVTGEIYVRLKQAAQAGDFTVIDKVLSRLIASWDVLEDDGVTPYPKEPEYLEMLPLLFKIEVLAAILQTAFHPLEKFPVISVPDL